MIISNKARMLGTRYAVVKNKMFAFGISLAPEGLFKGWSILLAGFDPDVDWQAAYEKGRLMPMAKFILHPSLTKAGRALAFDLVVEHLGAEDAETFGFVPVIAVLLERGKKHNMIIDSVVHPELQQELNQEQLLSVLEAAREPTEEARP
jgi:hypothetical protein